MAAKTGYYNEEMGVNMLMSPEEWKTRNWFKRTWVLIRETYTEFSKDNTFQLGAALSYYTVFSLAPLIVVIIAVAGMIYGREAVSGELDNQLRGLIGTEGAKQIQDMVASASKPNESKFAAIVAGVLTVFGATTLFGQLQSSLNAIWEVKAKASKGIVSYIVNRILSFSMILGIGFLLLVSLVLNTMLTVLSDWINTKLGMHSEVLMKLLDFVVSFGVITLLFAMIYKILPDAKVRWRYTWIGAVVTSLLFVIGKFAIGYYLGTQDVGSTYGAAGSLVLILLWVNYSSQILFFGAEFTQVYARYSGHEIEPVAFAVRVRPVEIEQKEGQDASSFEAHVDKLEDKFGSQEERREREEARKELLSDDDDASKKDE